MKVHRFVCRAMIRLLQGMRAEIIGTLQTQAELPNDFNYMCL